MKCNACGVDHKHNDSDPCLDQLPGLMNACCGHGDINSAYVQFLDGQCIRGPSAIVIQEELKKHSPEVPSPENFIQDLHDQIERVREEVASAMFFLIHKKPDKALECLKKLELDLWPDKPLSQKP